MTPSACTPSYYYIPHCCRHVPPPSSPPPPPPEVLRRPLLHYDGAALAQANLVQQLPQKKPGRRRFCNWRYENAALCLGYIQHL